MNRERWGTFSVKDHQRPRAFVAEVLLYDRLIVPVPSDAEERTRWSEMDWDPARLDHDLESLGDLAIRVPWDRLKRDAFKSRYTTAKAAAFDATGLAAAKASKQDPLHLTRMLLAQDFLPELPPGVTKVWPVAAYPSLVVYQEDVTQGQSKQKEKLAMVLTHRFLVPEDAGKSDAEMLKKAVELAKRDDFKEKRARLHRWQEDIIEQEIPPDKAVEEMEDHLKQYNNVVKQATKEVYWKFAFMAVPMGISIATAGLGAPLVIAGATGLISIAAFAKLDRKPRIEAGDCEAAAMIHDIHKNFAWT